MGVDGQLPKGWQERRLDEVADIRFSNVDKHLDAAQRRVRLCNYMDVWKNQYIHRGLDFMEGTASEQEIDRFGLQVGDVLLTKDSETREEIAEPSVVWDRIEGLVLGYHLALLRTNPESAYGPFLAAQLRIPEFRSQLVQAASGVTRYGLGLDAVKAATVWLPPVQKQRIIADVIRAFDEEIEATRAVIEQARQVKTALLQELLTNGLPGRHKRFKSVRGLGRIPADWGVERMADLTSLVTSGSRGWSQYITGDGAFFVRSQNIGLGTVLREDIVCVNPPDGPETERARIQPDDLLVSVTGEPGNVVRADRSFGEAFVSQHVALVRLKSPKLSRWLTLALCSASGQSQFQSKMYGQTRPGLNLENIDELLVPVPSDEEQSLACDLNDAVQERIDRSVKQLAHLTTVKAAMSQGLLTGRIPVKGGM